MGGKVFEERFDDTLSIPVKTVAYIGSEICCYPLSRCLLASKLRLTRRKRARKFRHRLWTNDQVLIDTSAVHRLAIAFLQPVEQLSAGAEFFVITISCDCRLSLDSIDKRSVLFERAWNEKEAFACETAQGGRIISFHLDAQAKHAGWTCLRKFSV